MTDMLEEKLLQARRGREIWLDIVERYGVDYDKLVYIMPHDDDELNRICMEHQQEVLASRRASAILIVTSESAKNSIHQTARNDRDAEPEYSNDIAMIVLTDEEMECLLKYNDMTEFSSQVILVSFTYGSDHSAEYLTHLGYSREELILVGLLNLKK